MRRPGLVFLFFALLVLYSFTATVAAPAGRPDITPWEPPPPPLHPPGQKDDESKVMSYDLRTGTVREQSLQTLQDYIPHAYTEAGIGVRELLEDPEGVSLNFQPWTLVGDPSYSDYPRRVRLFMNFVDTNGALHDSVMCSGTLIDPMHVLTAAHCVYVHEFYGTDIVVNDFAQWASAVPAYHHGETPFGDAHAVELHVWGNWIDDYDYDHDIGIIDLDRPIGTLTGWWGYGYNESCDFWEGGAWRHEGWPAEDPFDGQDMYRNYGWFDQCVQDGWVNRAMWAGPTWGGTSGAGAFNADADHVYGVFSTSNRVDVSVDCKLTPVKFIHITQMLMDDTPFALDLIPLDVHAPEVVEAGFRPSFLNFVVVNYSYAEESGSWPYSVYLSNDDQITQSDQLLGNATFDFAFTQNRAEAVAMSLAPRIPADTPAGDYYLGIILDTEDWNPGNNATSGQDAWPVQVQCPAAAAPGLNSPYDGRTCAETTQLFAWSATLPEASYQLQVGTVCGQGQVIETQLTYFNWEGLQPGTTYYWRVRSAPQCGSWGAWSDCWSFSTVMDEYMISSPVQPTDGQHCQPEVLTLRWAPLPGAESYDVQLSPNYCYEGTIYSAAGPALQVSGLTPNTLHYWRVRAHTVCGQTTQWSSAPGFCWTFKTAPTGVAAPVRIGPGDGTTCGNPYTGLHWSHAEDRDHYEVQVGTEPETGPVYTTSANVFTPPGLVSGQTYYWRVRTFHECGLASPWTSSWSFSFDMEPPINPTQLASTSHQPGLWSNDNTIDVAWNWGYDNCSGSWPQYATLWDQSPDTDPTEPTTSGELTQETSPPLPDADNHWFHLRTLDYAGNFADQTMHLGPFKIDATPPPALELDYATMDPGLLTGPTVLVVDWLPVTDATSGLAGYSWATGTTSTPPPGLDDVVDGTDPWTSAEMSSAGSFWFHVKALDAAGNSGGVLSLGPYMVDRVRLGIHITSPERDEILTQGQSYRILWDVADQGSFTPAIAELAYSLDGWETYLPIEEIPVGQIYLGYYDWTVPPGVTAEAVVRLAVTDVTGSMVYNRSVRFTLGMASPSDLPPAGDRPWLAAARPNPFNPQTTIGYSLPAEMTVSLRVYDALGRRVRTLVDGYRSAGWHQVVWDGRNEGGQAVSSGVYHYRLESGAGHQSRSMVLLK